MSQIDRLFVVDPVRHDRRGHHWHFAEGALYEAQARRIEARFFAALTAAGRPLPGPGFHPIFRHGLYQPIPEAPEDGVAREVAIGGDTMREDLLACEAFDPGTRDLVVVPTASFRNLAGLAKWRLATKSTTPLAFQFHSLLPAGTTLEAGTDGLATAHAAATLLREAATTGPCLVGATNEALADELAAALGRAVPVLPQPHWYDLEQPSPEPVYRPRGQGILTVAFIGEVRREKGGHLLTEIAELVRLTGYRMRLVVQAGFIEPALAEPLQTLARQGDVDLVARHLSNPAFIRFILDSPLILMPYERSIYEARISGPFAFAVAWGRPCIVPDGTWMASQIAAGRAAGIAYEGETPQAIADAVGRAIENLPQLTREAAERAPLWRRDDGTALFDRLIGWAAGA